MKSTLKGPLQSSVILCLTTNDEATGDIEDALLTTNTRDTGNMCLHASENIPLLDPMKRQNSKTFLSLYKSVVNKTGNVVKKVEKADRRLMQRLLNAQQSGRNVDMSSILKHKLSRVPLPLANTDGTINSKSALLGILSTGVEIATAVLSPYVSNAMVGVWVLIDGHALIQNLGKPAGCRALSYYADIFSKSIFSHFSQGAARVEVVFTRWFGAQSIKSQSRVKRGLRAKNPVSKVVSNGLVPLPQVWAQFVSLSENKADLAAFFVRRSCEEISKCPSRVRISFRWRLCLHRKTFIVQPRKGSRIDLWPRGGWYTNHPSWFRSKSERLWSQYGFLQRHWCFVALVALLWWNWSHCTDDWCHCTRTTLLSSEYIKPATRCTQKYSGILCAYRVGYYIIICWIWEEKLLENVNSAPFASGWGWS